MSTPFCVLLLLWSLADGKPCSCRGFLQTRQTLLSTSNPCGCNVEKLTSREELRNLPLAELRKRVATLTEKNNELAETLETVEKKQKEDLDARTKQVEDLWKEEHGVRMAAEEADDKRSIKLHEQSSKVKDAEEKVAKLNDDLSALRRESNQVNHEIAGILTKKGLSKCPGCNGKQLALVRTHREEPMELVMQIRRLEMKWNALMKLQASEQRRYGSEGRRLDKEKQKVVQTLDHQRLGDRRYEQEDAKRMKLVKRQEQILEAIVQDRENSISRMRASMTDMQEQIKLLKKCCK